MTASSHSPITHRLDDEPASDRTGRIETHGIDYIPEGERHGKPRSLFAVWAASNLTYLYIVLGGTLILLGLNVWQSLAVVLAGNLFWAFVGYLAITGPSSGTPSEIVTRAMFGIRGNRVFNLVIGWGLAVVYEAINLSIGALAGFAIVEHWGGRADTAVKLAIVLGTAVVAFTVSVYGHATIVRFSGWFAWVLLICFAVLGYFVLRRAHWGYQAPADYAVHGAALWAVAAIGFTIIASSPLSFTVGADYSRYLPEATSMKAVCWWTALGGFLPSIALGALGVLAGTVVDMTDPQTSLQAILPGWFYPIFLVTILIGSITNNVVTAYSGGLGLQAIGIPWRRSITVIFDAGIALAVTCYALFISNFLDTLNNILELSVALLGPAVLIYAVDVMMTRNRYDGLDLNNETPSSRYWYWHGVNLAGAIAMIVGTGAALLFVDTDVYVSPVAGALDGADLSVFVGSIVGGLSYAIGTLLQRRFLAAPTHPRATPAPPDHDATAGLRGENATPAIPIAAGC